MNKYQKLTLESFVEELHGKKFKGVAGARRSVGKAQHLSKADKVKAHEAINKFYKVEGAGPKKAAKTGAKKAAKKTAPKKVTTKREAQNTTQSTPAAVDALDMAARAYISPHPDDRAVRANAAAAIVTALYGRVPIDREVEVALLDRGAREYIHNSLPLVEQSGPSDTATSAVSQRERIARPRVPVQTKPKASKATTKGEASPPVNVPTATLAAAAVPENEVNGVSDAPPFDRNHCTPEQAAMYDALAHAKEVTSG